LIPAIDPGHGTRSRVKLLTRRAVISASDRAESTTAR
jgi:hypothetical protein